MRRSKSLKIVSATLVALMASTFIVSVGFSSWIITNSSNSLAELNIESEGGTYSIDGVSVSISSRFSYGKFFYIENDEYSTYGTISYLVNIYPTSIKSQFAISSGDNYIIPLNMDISVSGSTYTGEYLKNNGESYTSQSISDVTDCSLTSFTYTEGKPTSDIQITVPKTRQICSYIISYRFNHKLLEDNVENMDDLNFTFVITKGVNNG